MVEILTRAGCFIAIIAMGWLLRRIGFFKKEDFYLLSRIVVRITLTASIIRSFAGRQLEYSMLILTGMGLAFGVLMMAVGWLMNRKRTAAEQAFGILNTPGCNIGNFALPFVQSFLGPVSVMALSLFDVGNSIICLGGACAVAGMVADGKKRISVKPLLRALSRSVPLVAYVIMVLLAALRISLPGPVVEFVGILADANPFLAMLMIGVGFQLNADPKKLGAMARVLIPRFTCGILFSVLSFRYLPFPLEYRQALALLFLTPISSAAPAFTADIHNDYGLASAINSLSMVISIVLIVIALLLIL